MASSEGCSPYALSVGFLIGIFIGREDNPEAAQVPSYSLSEFKLQITRAVCYAPLSPSAAVLPACPVACRLWLVSCKILDWCPVLGSVFGSAYPLGCCIVEFT